MPRQTIKELCRQAGITPICYYKRIEKGMTKEEALTTPNKRKSSIKSYLKPKEEKKESFVPAMIQYGKIKSCVFEEDHINLMYQYRKKRAQNTYTFNGKVFEDEVKRISPKIKIYSNADFNYALGGYRISILNHIKEGEYRFQIIKLGEQTPFYTNNFQQFSQEINRILTLIRG